LRKAGYKVSWKKSQICQDTVKYIGFHLSQGQCRLSRLFIPAPKTHWQIRELLIFCRFLLDLDRPQLLFLGKTPLWSHRAGRTGTHGMERGARKGL
jgi:hypothetical protein